MPAPAAANQNTIISISSNQRRLATEYSAPITQTPPCGNMISSMAAGIDAQPPNLTRLEASEHTAGDVVPLDATLLSITCAGVTPQGELLRSSPDDGQRGETRPREGFSLQHAMVATSSLLRWGWDLINLDRLPNELLMKILGFLDVNDLLATSRVSLSQCCQL